MKTLILSLLVLFLSFIAQGQEDIWNIEPVREQSQQLLALRAQATAGSPFDLDQLKSLHRALVGNRTFISKMPKPMLEGIQLEIEPLRKIAKELAESANSDERYYGAIINSRLSQTEETRSLLLALAYDERPETAVTSLNVIFELKLDTPELRADLVSALGANPAAGKGTTLRAMARNNIGEWGIEEAVPELINILKTKSAKGGPIDGPAVVQLKALGPKARDALPLLESLLEERKAAGNAEFREIEALEFAVKAIDAPLVSSDLKGTDNAQSQESNGAAGDGAIKVAPLKTRFETFSKSSDLITPEMSTSYPWWLIASSIAIVVIALATWLKARKSKPTP